MKENQTGCKTEKVYIYPHPFVTEHPNEAQSKEQSIVSKILIPGNSITTSVREENSIQTLLLTFLFEILKYILYLSIRRHIINLSIQQNSAGTEW